MQYPCAAGCASSMGQSPSQHNTFAISITQKSGLADLILPPKNSFPIIVHQPMFSISLSTNSFANYEFNN
jgi:hypothetical protein